MKRPSDPFADDVRAFREMTSTPGDGRATRARVLATATARNTRRVSGRRLLVAGVIMLLAGSSASAAWRAFAGWRAGQSAEMQGRRPIPQRSRADVAAAFPAAAAVRPADSVHDEAAAVGVLSSAEATGAGSDNPELRMYASAHRSHFGDHPAPATALAAWELYLASYPNGTFVPEAHYNRVLCLVRLGRLRAAADGLRPFVDGLYGGYRRQDADRLLSWIGDRAR